MGSQMGEFWTKEFWHTPTSLWYLSCFQAHTLLLGVRPPSYGESLLWSISSYNFWQRTWPRWNYLCISNHQDYYISNKPKNLRNHWDLHTLFYTSLNQYRAFSALNIIYYKILCYRFEGSKVSSLLRKVTRKKNGQF